MTAARLTREKTRREYWNRFETFAECERLWTVTKAKLASRKGRELLIRHYGHISERSRPFVLSGIKKVWTRGLELPWPLLKDDLPKPPRPRRVAAPRRESVEPWARAMRAEADSYERSWFFVELNGGLRPIDQQAELRLADLVFNATGDLVGIHAEAANHGFKRDADIRQQLPQEVARALKDWLKDHPAPGANAFVWPWRNCTGRIDPNRMNTDKTIDRMRRNFTKRNRLAWLTSKDVRHFVRTVLNDSGMPKVERHYWQGHLPNLADMDERYGDRPVEETFEVQRRSLPQGVIGTFLRVDRAKSDMPLEVEEVWRKIVAGELDSLDAAQALKELARRVRQKSPVTEMLRS